MKKNIYSKSENISWQSAESTRNNNDRIGYFEDRKEENWYSLYLSWKLK
jgi:hypothetical protein